MKKFFSLCFILIFTLHIGCTLCSTKKVTCGAFNSPSFNKWFPYQEGSKIILKNTATADTFSYTIEQVNISGTYEIRTGGISTAPPQNCMSSAYFASANYNNSPFGVLRISYSIYNDNLEKRLEVNFNNGNWEAGEVFDSSIAPCSYCQTGLPVSITKEQNLVFDNGITYNNVVILTSDTTFNKLERAYKLFVAKNIGIIGCETFPSKQKWVIQ
jgi:hypothetical protein